MSLPFSDGFESGDFSQWTGNVYGGISPIINTTQTYVHSGLYSAAYSNTNGGGSYGYYYKTISGATNMRAYIYVGNNTFLLSDGDFLGVLGFELSVESTTAEITLCRSNGTMYWGIRDGNTQTNNPSSVSLTTGWHCIELAYNSPSGYITLFVDGSQIQSIASSCSRVVGDARFGGYASYSGPTSFSLYLDDVEASNAYIGPMNTANQTLTGVSLPLVANSSGVVSIPPADTSTNGYLSSTNWNTFNGKQNALTTGNLIGTSHQVNISGGTGSIIGSDVTLWLPQNIDSSATPTFAGLTINGALSTANNTLDDGSGIMTLTGLLNLKQAGNNTAIQGQNMAMDSYLNIRFGQNYGNWGIYSTDGMTQIFQVNDTDAPAYAVKSRYNWLDDGTGNMKLGVYGSSINLLSAAGNQVTIYAKDGMGTYPATLKVLYGLEADDFLSNGFISTTSVNIGGTGGGAIWMGHGFGVAGDMPVIELSDTVGNGFDKNYTTLWLKAGMGSPRKFALGRHGTWKFDC